MDLLVRHGAKIECTCKEGATPLSVASRGNKRKAVILLLKRGAEVDRANTVGETALAVAAIFGNYKIATLLLQHGADVEKRDHRGRTPLSKAAENGRVAVTAILLQHGANVASQDEAGQTPLELSAGRGFGVIFKLLFKQGIDLGFLSRADSSSSDPLRVGARYRDICHLIVDNNRRSNIESSDIQALLQFCVKHGILHAVQELLPRSNSLETTGSFGNTLLNLAASNGHVSVAQLLIENGAEIDASDGQGRTPLSRAASSYSIPMINNTEDHLGRTPLSYAAASRPTDILELLLKRGARLNQADKQGRTPLSWAAGQGRESFSVSSSSVFQQWSTYHDAVEGSMKVLLDANADPNAKDRSGCTPFLRACMCDGTGNAVRILLDSGVDPKVQVDESNQNSLLLLIQLWHDLEAPDQDNYNRMLAACRWRALTALVDRGADVNCRDNMGRSPLLLAASLGYVKTVALFLEKGADPNVQDRNGQTLSVAISGRHDEVAKLLHEKIQGPVSADSIHCG